MRTGAIPVPVSTMLRADEVAELLVDSRARFLAVTREFSAVAAEAAAAAPELAGILADHTPADAPRPVHLLDAITAAPSDDTVYSTTADSPAFWLYTSGTTGKAKAAMHRHGAIPVVCETYGAQVLGIHPDDRCLSAAKAFFAYGLGNSVLFPLSVGAAAVLEPSPARPEIMAERAGFYAATLFFAGPTFFANMLRAGLSADALAGVRLAASAGEALPAALYQRWTSRFGVDIIDGLGMTEMLHIFLSNQPGQVRAGTTGVAVPGYDLRLLDEEGNRVPDGTPGTLKASGIWVSPAEVEARLLAHQAVAQAVVVAARDTDGLEKPVAFVVPQPGRSVTEAELIEFCRQGLPSVKRPRKVVFTEVFPTTATGKVRRVELRELAASVFVSGRASRPGIPAPGGAVLSRRGGHHQLLDIGSGLPTKGNVSEVAQEIDPGARGRRPPGWRKYSPRISAPDAGARIRRFAVAGARACAGAGTAAGAAELPGRLRARAASLQALLSGRSG